MDAKSWNEHYDEKINSGKKELEITKFKSVEEMMEVKSESDPTSQDTSELVEDVLETTSPGAQFSCSECQASFDTSENCMNHKAVVHSVEENQSRGGLQQELQKCERWYVDKCREIAMAPREVCLEN